MSDIGDLTERVRQFADARDWQQFHTPKNLAMALAGEVGELLAEMQWLTDAEVVDAVGARGDEAARIKDEMADVFIYLVRLADTLGIDLARAAHEKIDRNESRYPVHLARGTNQKHDVLRDLQE
ncbi:nucleotide pyrophosphohydrolase [Oerskovia sp. Root22]|uniref:nucleotide pyrophosphohydrolase n=1 Tax=Oerskovia sp. Root22 TaxID=1736494 RepID=UPI0006F9B695|nr:nucleotide pyrophosphohydrolase [Oerskovia sp. Root22]KRC37496.1 nucleotide pyrophosphohydrolase [Oerskovia sp. Root22]